MKANLNGRCESKSASMHVSHEGTALAVDRLFTMLGIVFHWLFVRSENFFFRILKFRSELTNLNIWPERKRLTESDPRITIEPVEPLHSLLESI